jgi:hypothetical protein
MPWALRVLTVVVLAILLVGCGSGRIKARGRLVKNGEPFVPGEREVVHIAFFALNEDPKAKSYVVKFDRQDGTFQVTGSDGKGLPPGKYRVAVSLIKDHKDALNGAFDLKNSPFLCDVDNSSEEISLDLATPSKAAAPAKAVRKDRSK